MAPFWKKAVKWAGRIHPMAAPLSLLTRSDKPRDLARSLGASAVAGAGIAGGASLLAGIRSGASVASALGPAKVSAIPNIASTLSAADAAGPAIGTTAGTVASSGGGPLSALKTGAKYAPAVIAGIRGLRKHKATDWSAIQRWMDANAPIGPTAADYAEGQRTTSDLNEGVDAGARNARADAMTRMIRNGTLGAPGNEATLSRLEQIRAKGRMTANRAGRAQVYQAGLGRERFRQGLQSQMFGAQMNEAIQGGQLADAASADSLSSALQYLQILQGLTRGGGSAALLGDVAA